jgi:tungstate transport system ATP-binding protein
MREAAAASERTGAALLAARGLVFEAGGRRLIDRIDIDIPAGSRLVIMGANGAGKSLLLRLLHGLIAPCAGTVQWRGQRLDRAARNCQAMVFQHSIMLRRSVVANLHFALAVRRIDRAERARRSARALENARLGDLARRPARVLSAGEQQRLAMVRALACGPEILLLDEPTANLDPDSTLAIENLVGEACRQGVTVVTVTHDPRQARRLGDAIAFMHCGRIAEFGAASSVLDRPCSNAARAWLEGRLAADANPQETTDAKG